ETERSQAVVVGRVERGERVVVAAQQGEVARALEVDHRFGRIRGAGLLERGQRLVVALELALGLRDAQQAQAVLCVAREDRAVLADRVFPAALLEGELGGVGDGVGLAGGRLGGGGLWGGGLSGALGRGMARGSGEREEQDSGRQS